MVEIYCAAADEAHERLKRLLSGHIPAPIEILRTENGKPYIKDNPVFFSLSHSGDKAVIAVSSSPVGIDLELFKGKTHLLVMSRFSGRENAEICGEKDFLKHWTAREAFVKYSGGSLAEMWKRVEFFGGNILLDGEKQNVKLRFYEFYYGIAALCAENNS